MIGWLIGLGMPEPVARIARWVALGALILALGTCAVLRIREDARRDEQARVAVEQAKADQQQREAERAAEDQRRRELTRAQAEAANRQKEIDDATRHLPATPTSPRQRVRACAELRRQAEARSEPPPAC